VLGLLTILNDFGLDLAVVAYRELTESQMAQLNVLAVVVGSAAVALSCAAAFVWPIRSAHQSCRRSRPPSVRSCSSPRCARWPSGV